MDGEGPGDGRLEEDLGDYRQRAKGRDEGGRGQIQTEPGSHQVGGAEEIQAAGKEKSRVSLQGGADRVDLPFIDGQMGRHGPPEALTSEFFLGGFRLDHSQWRRDGLRGLHPVRES
ncbi:hypothetical protein IFM61606_09307 [Aspergillus udagawae]|uniref:Uncharacterized protein n=1 Tax=Aspergillus udagawae TaxID=91492 RepID=A0ABQ1BCJ8_9EURO|nr:hypothetical protein IFM61606_09307 [Aspergillus udagawae]GFF56686.1 hypothetical protein IFM51744_08971 [Aspergillus udagawae]GFF98523.1 hypothetical protein IFM53868_09839 [Aspergillus udagawae]